MKADPYTLFPWILLDGDLIEEDPTSTAIEMLARHLRRCCSVMIGELDFQHIREQAESTGRRTARLLLDALEHTAVRFTGLSIDDPTTLNFTTRPLGTLLAADRPTTTAELLPPQEWIHFGSDAFARSVIPTMIEESQHRTYVNFSRQRIWQEALEPFTRAATLNIYDRYIFNRFCNDAPTQEDVRRSGLWWFLLQLSGRCAVERSRMTVAIRGSYARGPGQGFDERRTRELFADTVSHFADHLDLHLEVCTGRVPHDRVMLARTPSGGGRVLQTSNSVFEKIETEQYTGRDGFRIDSDTSIGAVKTAEYDWHQAGRGARFSYP